MPAKYERLVFASLLFLFSIAILYAGLQFLEKMAQKLELHKGWSRIRIIDKSTLNTFHPNMTPKEASVGGRSPYFTNSIGFRDSEVKLVARKHDGYRILFIGDSFTEGYKVKWADTFAGRIKFYFQNNNSSVEILNGGIGGFSTGQEYLRIKQFFDKGYSANLVILLVDFSDIYEQALHEVFTKRDPNGVPLWVRSQFIETLSNFHVLDLYLESALFRILYNNFIKKLNPKHIDFNHQLRTVMGYGSKTGWLYKIQWESQVYWKLYGEKAFGLVKKDILSTSSYLKEQGAELLLAFYPWPLNLKDELAFIGGNWPELRYLKQRAKEHHYEDLMVQFAEKNSLKFINIFPEFRKVQDHLLDYYITNDVHFNAKGHELKAKVILRYLQENYSDRFHQ